MSEVDELEALSNADLRAKCLQHGLPNVPVTDSSRKVLIKKLRVSLGGSGSPAASPKKTNRRETLHAAKPLTFENITTNEQQKDNQRAKNRRTIAASSIAEQKQDVAEMPTAAPVAQPARISERRRSREPTNTAPVVQAAPVSRPEPLVEVEEEGPPPLVRAAQRNIMTTKPDLVPSVSQQATVVQQSGKMPERERQDNVQRRPAVHDDDIAILQRTEKYINEQRQQVLQQQQELKQQQQQQQQKDAARIVERRTSGLLVSQEPEKNYMLMNNSYIVLDSEEDDDELLHAVQEAEKRSLPPAGVGKRITPLSFGMSQTVTTSSYDKETTTIKSHYESPLTMAASYTSSYDKPITSADDIYKKPYSYDQLKSSAYLPPSQRYTMASSSIPTTSKQRVTPAVYYNEYSDDGIGEEDSELELNSLDTPFLSDFARSLERLKAEPLGGGGGMLDKARFRRTIGGGATGYEPTKRRSMRDESVESTFMNLWLTLDRKYNLKTKLIIVFIFLLLVALYVIFF